MPDKKNRILNAVYPLFSVFVIAVLWIVFYRSAGSEFIFPSVVSVFKKISEYFISGFFWNSFFNTFLRVITSFFIALIAALLLGVLSFIFPATKKIMSPFIKIMISIPTVALMIIFNMMMISSKAAPVLVALTVIFPMLYSAASAAFSQIDSKLLEMAKVYKVSVKKQIFSLIIPSVIPYIAEQCGTVLSFTLKITVSAEIIASTYKSLGGILQQANVYIDMAGVMAMTLISVVVAIILEGTVALTVKLYKRRKKF